MRLAALICAALLAGPATAQQITDSVAPEAGSTPATHVAEPVQSENWMISAANPHAVQAGAEVLRSGGTAADAMVAVQAVLGLVEPQSSGLGGGAFLVWFDAATGRLTTLDGRETAPLAAKPTLFQDETGAPLKFFDAVVGGRSVGTPGTPALMAEAHARWGKMEWAPLLAPAIKLADEGFAVSPRLSALIARDAERLATHPKTAAYFLPQGQPLSTGTILRNPEYADTLKAMANEGLEAFYAGDIARDIVRAVQTAAGNPGVLSDMDLAIYRIKERAPVCVPYRIYDICGMGPPSSGALTIGQILGMLDHYDLAALGPENPEAWRLIGDASRLAFADRGRYMADSDFVPVPIKGLVSAEYLASRAALLSGKQALETVLPGQPEFDHALKWADDDAIEHPSTSHFSIVDSYGNALSVTTTIENAFGSRVMVRGFLLNNELTDFSFRSHKDGVPVANRVEPGKRPRSSMAPTIVMQEGKPRLVIGSPGGSRIIGYVTSAIIAWADWNMDIQSAVSFPHAVNRFGTYDLEQGTPAEALQEPLELLGYKTAIRDLNSGLHAIDIGPVLSGAADPRREGIVLGE